MASSIRNLPRGSLFLLFLFLTGLSLVWAEFYLQSTNTLIRNPHWESSKLSLDKAVNGALAFMVTPVALHRNHLNLSAWYGYQELWWKEPIDPQEIGFDLLLPKESVLTFLYNKTPQGFSGIRFSRNALYENLHFTADGEGRFTKKEPFPPPPFKEGWNRIRFLFGDSGIRLWVNGRETGSFSEKLEPLQKIGFRGGAKKALIDNLEIHPKGTAKILRENFQNPRPFWPVAAGFFLAALFLEGIVILLARRKPNTADAKKFLHGALLVSLLLLILSPLFSFTYYGFLSDRPLFAKLYFKAVTWAYGYRSNIETKEEVLSRLSRQVPTEDPSHPVRVLLIGSSQTWGAGASRAEKTFARRLEDRLNEKGSSKKYEVINTGISGEKSFGLYEFYTREWIAWRPHVAAIDLSNNDVDPERFAETLRKWARFNREKGIQTLFILEANAPEAIKEGLPANHEKMREVAGEFKIPLVDLHGCLKQRYDEGILWWDFVHPTNLGHEWAAECIEPALSPLIHSPPDPSP